jgi:polysaccharide pyruvyl transferase WcaK-like protein
MPHSRDILTSKNIKKDAIIIAGEWHSNNLGDEIICKTFKYLLQDYLFANETAVLELDISMNERRRSLYEKLLMYIYKLSRIELFQEFSWYLRGIKVVKELKRIIGFYTIIRIIIPGGQLFQNYFAMSLRLLILEAAKYHIPVFFNACGIGPNSNKSLSTFRWILEQPCVKQVTTRDDLSTISQNIIIKIIPDIAIMSYSYYNFISPKIQKQIIGINIIAPIHYRKNSFDKLQITDNMFGHKMKVLIENISKIYKVSLFSNGANEDQKYLDWIYCRLENLGNISIEERPRNGFELIKIISAFSLVIGFRLHSLIVSYSFNIPSIGIAWDNKLYYWGNMTENENIYTLSELSVENICELINDTIKRGINKNKKAELECQIKEQMKNYC